MALLAARSGRAQVCDLPGSDNVNGSVNACSDFRVALIDIGPIEPGFDITDEGWVFVNRSHAGMPRTRCVSGYVKGSSVARNDTPANHYSHDMGVGIVVDPGQEDVLSNVNAPNNSSDDNDLVPDDEGQTITPDEIEMEWETGILPTEKSGDGAHPIFPKWAWPTKGDRVWVDGNWVFDCGHGKKIGHYVLPPGAQFPIFVGAEYFRTEIHPARAIASMRSQVGTLPGTGTTPVPVTATDLYIHGRGGFITDILNCGMKIILEGVDTDGDGEGDGNPDVCPIKTTPIDDNFEFEICLPPRPHVVASLDWIVEGGPGDTVPGVVPSIVEGAASAGCANDGDPDAVLYDLTTSLHVTIPLAGTGVAPTSVYARRIRAGWVFPDPALRHLTVTLQKMDLHNDTDDVPTDTGELTFFWMGVNRAPDAWARLADFDVPTHDDCGVACFAHTNTMNDYDDDDLCCNGELNFEGPTFDFFVARGQSFTIRAQGYDQDCYDFSNNFTDHHLSLGLYAGCHTLDIDEYGNNDSLTFLPSPLPDVAHETTFGPPGYGVGFQDLHAWKNVVILGPNNVPQIVRRSDYELEVVIGEVPLALEDRADLSVDKSCATDGEVALVGEPFHCTVTVRNLGPGLPREVKIDDTLTGPGAFVLGTPRMTVGSSDPVDCAMSGTGTFTCDPVTVPVGGTATVTVDVTAQAGGDYVNAASSSTASDDPASGNDVGQATVPVFIPIALDVAPGSDDNAVNVGKSGAIAVAILTTPSFDASSVAPLSACFGDAGAPAERDCTEVHGKGHLQDVDRDRDLDLVLHFDVTATGIDLDDTRACLIGTMTAGIGVYGCDRVTPRP